MARLDPNSEAAGGLAAGICASAGVKEAKAATMNATMSAFSIKFPSFEKASHRTPIRRALSAFAFPNAAIFRRRARAAHGGILSCGFVATTYSLSVKSLTALPLIRVRCRPVAGRYSIAGIVANAILKWTCGLRYPKRASTRSARDGESRAGRPSRDWLSWRAGAGATRGPDRRRRIARGG